jgi:hypothetical protein
MHLGRFVAVLPAAALLWAATDIGNVTRVVRTADLLRGKSTAALKERDGVAENDRIRTQASGRARVVLHDGSILNIGSSTLFTVKGVTEGSRAGSLEIAYGRIRAEVAASAAGGRFQIRTSTAVCGVLGTTVFVDASRDLTRVANLSDDPKSLVRVVSSDAKTTGEVILKPGEGTSVPVKGGPQPPRKWSLEEVQNAQQDTIVQ